MGSHLDEWQHVSPAENATSTFIFKLLSLTCPSDIVISNLVPPVNPNENHHFCHLNLHFLSLVSSTMSKPYIIVRFTTIFSQKLSSSPLLCTVPCWPQVFKLISFHSFCSLTITPASVFFTYMYMLLLTRSSSLKNMPPPLQILICQHQTLTADHSVVCLIITTATKKGLRADFSPQSTPDHTCTTLTFFKIFIVISNHPSFHHFALAFGK